jgi:pilus assembly protein FimV
MNMNYVILRSSAFGGLLLLVTSSSFAVSLGPVRGAALVGRTLDLSILVRLEANDDPAALCTEAELTYSETRIDSGKIVVRTSATGEPGQALIRVTSSAIVDEPVVSLNLRAGCSARNSRRYVLLADLPLQAAERPASSPSAAPESLSGLLPAPSAPSRGAGTGLESNVSRAARVPADSVSVAAPPAAVRAPRRPRPGPRAGEATVGRINAAPRPAGGALVQSLRLGESAERGPGAPRLRLDSAELPAESTPSLKSFSELQSLPSESNPRRSEFAALWRALNLRPDEVARDAQRLDELQAQTRSLRDVNAKSQAELGLARDQLKKAEVERYANPVVYSLLALLAALMLGAGYVYYRFKNTGRGAAWWDQRDAEPVEREKTVKRVEPRSMESRFPAVSVPVLTPQPLPNSSRLEENSVPAFRASDSAFSASGISAGPRGVNVNELFDIAQQADFFVSLGQHDHAIEVLSNHIHENVQTSPLAYLDLFKLYHDMDRQRDYDELRVDFNRIFNAEVPPFEGFRQRGEGLDAYEGALSRIQSLWNTPRVLDVIEESLFRKPGQPSEAFGLEAYRELLLLYAIANELMDSPREPDFDPTDLPVSPTGSFPVGAEREPEADADSLTELQPLSASAPYGVGELAMTTPAGLTTSRSGRVGLDIDLTDAWLGVDSPEGDDTVILRSRKPEAFQPASSAWLDFDLSDIRPAVKDADAVDETIGNGHNPPRA